MGKMTKVTKIDQRNEKAQIESSTKKDYLIHVDPHSHYFVLYTFFVLI